MYVVDGWIEGALRKVGNNITWGYMYVNGREEGDLVMVPVSVRRVG